MSEPFLGMIILVRLQLRAARLGVLPRTDDVDRAEHGAVLAARHDVRRRRVRRRLRLPDLRGRVPIGAGQGPGLSNYTSARSAGVETSRCRSQPDAVAHACDHARRPRPATANVKNGRRQQQDAGRERAGDRGRRASRRPTATPRRTRRWRPARSRSAAPRRRPSPAAASQSDPAAVSGAELLHRARRHLPEPKLVNVEQPSPPFAQSSRRRRPPVAVVCLLALSELAAFAADFVVTKTADTNDGVCNADCSLREAIIAANAEPRRRPGRSRQQL